MMGEESSEIAKFFEGESVFITGGTGFLGRLVIEKLLRSCPDIQKMYLLIRPKKGKDVQKRLNEQFQGVLFDRLRKERPNFMQKIQIIEGDISCEGLGINNEEMADILNEVGIIFHGAATLNFDLPLKTAITVNVRGTREMMALAHSCKKIKSFVYISTAYSNCPLKHIEEKVYDLRYTGDKMIDLAETLDSDVLEKIKDSFVGEYPNTYAYSKSLAEDIVKVHSKGLNIAVVRPSIVIGTKDEPVKGWIDTIYGATGIMVGAGIGLLHSLYSNRKLIADLVPADFVVNATIASAPYVYEHRPATPMVFNYASQPENPVTWERLDHLGKTIVKDVPSVKAVGPRVFKMRSNYYTHLFVVAFTHWLPAYIVDTGLRICGKEPLLVNAYKKIHRFSQVLSYFLFHEWDFDNHNTQMLFRELNEVDKVLFNFDMKCIQWETYMKDYILGMRAYVVKDPIETVPQGLKRQTMLNVAFYIYVILITSIVSFIFYYILTLMF